MSCAVFEKKNRCFFLEVCAGICLIFLLFSCAGDTAEISNATESLILEYSNSESFPESRLAVFIQPDNAVQRTEDFSVENLEHGYVWNVNSPEIFEASGKQFAYCAELRPPDGEHFPKGNYRIVYNDAAGNSSEVIVQLDYDENILRKKSSEIAGFISEKVENIALYDEMNELIYFGRRKNGWNSKSDMLKEYKNAFSMRICYSSPSNSLVCFMPEEFFERN